MCEVIPVLYTFQYDTADELSAFWQKAVDTFSNGYLMAEFFSHNLFRPCNKVESIELEDLISCRFFDGERQLKCRRIKNNIFWAVADFLFDGFHEVPEKIECSENNRSIVFWGDWSADIDYFYEERIPYLFKNFSDSDDKDLKDKDRLAIEIVEYKDNCGNVVWERFGKIKKWNGNRA